jgi:[histone H3]-trimethyl-L-lysine4 demethylase
VTACVDSITRLNDSLKEMVDRETALRKQIKSLKFGEVLEEEDRPSEEQYQCTICKVFLYLSQVTCQCTTQVTCVEHADRLCKCAMSSRVLRKRFSDEELLEIYAKVSERARIPDAWRTKLNNLLSEGPRPQLRALRAILGEGERINHPMAELQVLRKSVARAIEWVDAANSFVVRKPNRKRTRKSSSRGGKVADAGANGIDEPYDRPERGLEDVYTLLREVEHLGFECPEIAILRNLAHEAENIKVKARQLLATPEEQRDTQGFVQECETLLLNGSSLNIFMAELFEVEQIFLREQLIRELDESEPNTLDDVRHLVARARTCKLPQDSKYMKILDAKQAAGSSWEDNAKALIAQRVKSMEELEEFAKTEPDVPVSSALLDRILSLHSKAKEYQKQADAMIQYEPGAPKFRPQDAMKLVTRAERDFNIQVINDLRRTTDFALDLESRCELVIKGKYQHHESEGDIFTMFHQWTDYAREHLVMFSMPHFEQLDKQLTEHYRWLECLPWYCHNHGNPHGKSILNDVLEATRDGDDTPPNDEYLSCICTTPVRPPAPGGVSDAVQCDHCFARFHGECAANGGSCPFCDHHHWNGTIHKDRNWHYTRLFDMAAEVPDITRGYSEYWKHLESIIHRVDRLVNHIGQFLNFASQSANQRSELLPRVRHYMRKLFKIQFVVGHDKGVSYGLDLAGLHRHLATQPPPPKPRKKKRPRLAFGQDYDKDWLDGTRCICRGRTEYLINYPKVQCEVCQRFYHGGCVFYPIEHANTTKAPFICPLCCLRKNKKFPYSDVRVRHTGRFSCNFKIFLSHSLFVVKINQIWMFTLIQSRC